MPTLKVTPDLGWVNLDDMFDSSKNPALYEKDVTLLDVATVVEDKKKIISNLSFDTGSGVKKVPQEDLHNFNGSFRYYWWRIDSGNPQSFVLLRDGV